MESERGEEKKEEGKSWRKSEEERSKGRRKEGKGGGVTDEELRGRGA